MTEAALLEQSAVEAPQSPPETVGSEVQAESSPAEERPGTSGEPRSLMELIRKKIKPEEKREDEVEPEKPLDKETTEKKPRKVAKVKKPEVEPEDAVDPIKFAEAQGREIARTLAEEMRPKTIESDTEQSQEDISAGLPEEYKADIEVYTEMQKSNPAKYGQLLKKLRTAAEKETEYISQWEEDHPGEDYDPEDTDHNAFYKKHFPEIPPKDFDAAKESVLEAKIAARLDAKYQSKLETIERSQASEKIAPVISEQVGGMVKDVLRQIDAKLAEAASDPVKLAALEESHPMAAEALLQTHHQFSPLLSANVELHRGITRFDANNPAHFALYELAQQIEAQTSKASLENRMDSNGRVFATRDAYQNMNERERVRHWIVDENVIAYVVGKRASAFGKQAYDNRLAQFNKWLKAQQTRKQSVPNLEPTKKSSGQSVEPEEPETEEHTSSPSVPGSGQVPSPWSGSVETKKKPGDYFLDYLKRR